LAPGLFSNLKYLNIDAQWYVRSNGCKDDSISYLESLGDKVSILKKDHNRDNFSQGVNSLANLAKDDMKNEDLFLLLNNDIFFKDSNSLKAILETYLKYKPGVVGAKLNYFNSNKLQHAGVIFSSKYGNMPWHYRASEEQDLDSCRDREFQAVTGACLLTPCDLFFKTGMLDEKFNWAFEDIAYTLKVGKTGRKIIYCGGANIEHGESVSLKKNPVNKLMMGPNVKHFKENYGSLYKLDHDFYLKNKDYKLI
jgi:GT2 family glycosyltransferase